MDCKFLSNGIAIQYHNFVKPCCVWEADNKWTQEHSIKNVNLVNWHNHKDLVNARKQLNQGIWPKSCQYCQTVESQGRQNSMRLNGQNAYGDFQSNDLTLEIRPGNVCNFACQTCWPAASTRVEAFYKKADIPNPQVDLQQNNFENYDFLLPIASQLKSIVLLGGEPFYDPKCIEFLHWAKDNTTANLLVFTNGSTIDFNLLSTFKRKIRLVFSLDAVGTPAEYIRYGTKWNTVWSNYQKAKSFPNVTTRINITTSPYNYIYFSDILDLVLSDWPEVVSFGPAIEKIFSEQVIPVALRSKIIDKLSGTVIKLQQAKVEKDQKANAVNAVNSIITNLKELPYDLALHQQFIDFVSKMDSVKNKNLADFCPENIDLLTVQSG